MERRFAVHAGTYRQALIVAIVLASALASAAPKNGQAKKLFDRGVAAYTKGDFAAAATALSESYSREGDPETLFAWAQAERKIGHCDKAIDLYNTLLAFDLPVENKKVIEAQLGECNQIVAASAKPSEPKPEPKPEPAKPEPEAAAAAEPVHEPTADGTRAPSAPEGHAWWRDPVGDALVASGAVGVGVGVALLVSARSADQAKSTAGSYAAYKSDADTAHDRGVYGVIGLAAGSALAIGGVVWYATHREQPKTAVTGWVAPTSGGLAITRAF